MAAKSRGLTTGMAVAVLFTALAAHAVGQAPPPTFKTPRELMTAVVENENAAAARHDRYDYLSSERSGRTGNRLWTERVVETAPGRMRRLIAIDGRPLTPEEEQRERQRLQNLREHPEVFIHHEQGNRGEERRARALLEVLPHDFLFDNVVLENGQWRMNFRPNPEYQPSGLEERVLHEMAGTLVIDAKELRLIHMDFHLTQDVGIGFGLLGDVHSGTTFISDRQQIDGRWHTLHISTAVHAKAMVFKSVDLNIDVHRSDFRTLDHEVSVPEAASMLLDGPKVVTASFR
jgi:hypothetical protein